LIIKFHISQKYRILHSFSTEKTIILTVYFSLKKLIEKKVILFGNNLNRCYVCIEDKEVF